MTTTATTTPKPPPPLPPPPKLAPSNSKAAAPVKKRSFAVESGIKAKFQRSIIYGSGGIGKTELASLIKDVGIRPLFLDLEDGTKFLNVDRIRIDSWDDLRGVLHDETIWKDFDCPVVDNLTKAEEFAGAWVIANVPHEKGHMVNSIEGYGFGKGNTHIYEAMLHLFGDLDTHIKTDRQVICIAHDTTSEVPNPDGDDFIRWEPLLQNPTSGKNSVRSRAKNWADHMFFIRYDTIISKDGKAQGSGTRTIYPVEMPTHLAKSRTLSEPIPYLKGDSTLWQQLFAPK